MEKWKRIARWGLLLWKRLYKKLTFVLLLVMIPTLVFVYGQVSREDSGLATIALASRTPQVERLTQAVWEDLMDSQVIRYIVCDTPEAAEALVRAGEADAAWIFEPDLEASIYDFIAKRSRNYAFVTVLEPRENVLVKLTRELLSGTLFPHCSQALYITYIRENAPELAHLSDETLLEYYDNVILDEELFIFTDMEGNTQAETEQSGYLLAPVRGMLAVLAVLAGLANAMYYIRDTQNGTFAWIPQTRQGVVELGCQLISLVNVLAVVLLSLALTGQGAALGRELLAGGLYCLCVAAFTMLIRRVTGGIRGLGMATPLLIVVMLVVCPVFFDLAAVRRIQYLFPPTYFINAAHNARYLVLMGIYTLALFALCWLIDLCKARFRPHMA